MADKAESECLAKSREQRKNAGNKMSKLLADELGEDEFYKTALGGFAEESGDEEYASEADESDQVDSDFSLSETDEVIEQDVEDDSKKKRKKTFFKKSSCSKAGERATSSKQEPKITKEKKIKTYELKESRRKSTRAATVQSSDKHRKRMEGKKVDKKQVKFSQLRPLTQKELLAEAEITEQLNIASLKAYQQMEETKKKAKNVKPVRKEAMIRYLSLSMPLIEASEENEIKVDDDINIDSQAVKEKETETSKQKCSRNFIIFTDAKTFPGNYFASNKVSIPQKAYCPVTGLPAKYKDPVTGLPYATAQAFRYIREHYAKQSTMAEDKTTEGRLRSSRRSTQQTLVEAK